MKKILITGGCGYIGSKIARFLSERGDRVTVFDLVVDEKVDRVDYVRGDIRDPDLVDELMKRGFQVVVHVAGFGLSGSENLPFYDGITENVNVEGTRNVVDSALKNGIEFLVYTSTVNVGFGGNEVLNGDEDDSNESFVDRYSETKFAAENIVRNSGLRNAILRIGGVYGPGEKSMIPRSIRCVKLLGYFHALDRSDKLDFLTPIYGSPPPDAHYFTPNFPFRIPRIVIKWISMSFYFLSSFGFMRKMPFFGFTPMEVAKMTTTHYFSNEKAKRLLGYNPRKIQTKDWETILTRHHLNNNM